MPVPKPRSGRPALISPHTSKVIRRDVVKDPASTARDLKEQHPDLLGGPSGPSVRTFQRHLHDNLGYKSYRAVKKPMITLRQKKNRVEFAKRYKEWTDDQWNGVVWSDESMFTVTDGGKGKRV